MSTCNFRCQYCFWDAKSLGARVDPPAPVEKLASFFDRSGLRWLLHLTGGEPLLYPHFVKLCSLLVSRHLISLNTNADSPRITDFARAIDPGRVEFINVGVHPLQRRERNNSSRLINNYSLLKDAGFTVFASCVMYPSLRSEFDMLWSWYADKGITMIPKVLQGQHLGLLYPNSYTSAEREWIREYTDKASQAYADEFSGLRELPTINPLLDANLFLQGLPDYRGDLCEAGHTFVRIRENGDIKRCGPDDLIGNIVEGWFARRPGPSTCRELECPYFCEKYRVAAGVGTARA